MKSFWRSVASVLTGTVVAQAIPLLGSLVLARQYAPAEFGAFSVWLGVVLFLSVVLTGRFEAALAVEPDGEPRRMALLATLATIKLTVGVGGLLALFAAAFLGGSQGLSPALIVGCVPAAGAIAVAQTWQSWAAAEGNYRQLTVMRVVQAVTVTGLQIAAGVFLATATALAVAYLLGALAAVVVSTRLLPAGRFPAGGQTATVADFWRRHRRFPLFSLPADAISAAAAQLPVVIVASRFGAEIAGLLALTLRVLGAPMGLLGRSVLDVFKRHAASSFRERGECRREYLQTLRVLGVGAGAFVLVMALISEDVFAVAFGERWRESGRLAIWLLPVFAFRFLASPLSYMVYIARKQHVDLFWQVALLGVTVAALNVPRGYDASVQVYSGACSLLYVVYLALSYRFSLGHTK